MAKLTRRVEYVIALLIVATVTISLAACTKANNPPAITSLIADAYSVASGTGSHITCTASDEDGDTLSYTWMASGGDISGVGNAITWLAPSAAGTYSIIVTVRDGMGYTTQSYITINVEPTLTPTPTPTPTPVPISLDFTQIKVVCATCTPELLWAKTLGIQESMQRMVNFCGTDILPDVYPLTFHLEADDWCPQYQSGFTATFGCDSSGHGNICLWDMEHEIVSETDSMFPRYPFTVENASKIENQLGPVHEAMHGWFQGRQENGLIQEPFCKWVSFVISEAIPPDPSWGPDYCGWFISTPDEHPDALMKYLCQIGMTSQRAAQILNETAQSAASMGRALSDAEFADIVSAVLGQDAIPAFQAAGILP